jgi:hypothetical protein
MLISAHRGIEIVRILGARRESLHQRIPARKLIRAREQLFAAERGGEEEKNGEIEKPSYCPERHVSSDFHGTCPPFHFPILNGILCTFRTPFSN